MPNKLNDWLARAGDCIQGEILSVQTEGPAGEEYRTLHLVDKGQRLWRVAMPPELEKLIKQDGIGPGYIVTISYEGRNASTKHLEFGVGFKQQASNYFYQ